MTPSGSLRCIPIQCGNLLSDQSRIQRSQRNGLSAEQNQPALAERDDMPRADPSEHSEAAVMVLRRRSAEMRLLVRPHYGRRIRFVGH